MQIVVTDADDPPFAVDGTVHEEDTWRTMSAPTDVIRSPGHPVRVMSGAWEARPAEPGTVTVLDGHPVRLLAIVHDLDAERPCRLGWVEQALGGIFEAAERRRLAALRLPLLGARHGRLSPEAVAGLLCRQLLRRGESGALRRIWLVNENASAERLLRVVVGQAPASRDDPA